MSCADPGSGTRASSRLGWIEPELDHGTQFNASPAIEGEKLYLRSDRYLYCITGT